MFAHHLPMLVVRALASPLFAFLHHEVRAVSVLGFDLVGVRIYSLDLVAFTQYFQTPQLPWGFQSYGQARHLLTSIDDYVQQAYKGVDRHQ